jgi:hypothetical protein
MTPPDKRGLSEILNRAAELGGLQYRLSYDESGDPTTRWQRLVDCARERVTIQRELEDIYAAN